MNTDAASLDRLHDLILPPAVGWWPLAPGWYTVLALLGLLAVWFLWRYWKHWRANAYRREALQHLRQLQDCPAISELLRRTALAVVPRTEIAGKTGPAWADWLADRSHESMSPEVYQMLSLGVYDRSSGQYDISLLHDYAARWISTHQLIIPPAKEDSEV